MPKVMGQRPQSQGSNSGMAVGPCFYPHAEASRPGVLEAFADPPEHAKNWYSESA